MTGELLIVVGARPNFVKVAPVVHLLAERGEVAIRVLHTGQHYDHLLAGSFLEQLNFPPVDFTLGVGSGTHAEQTGAVMMGVERVLANESFAGVLVAGDVNSTMAAALAAAKLRVPVVHLEAGLRSGDMDMPEEVNRIVTDSVSDLLLCHSAEAVENLTREGIPAERIELVGNTMIDSLFAVRSDVRSTDVIGRLGLRRHAFVLVTLHRPTVVDESARLAAVLTVLRKLAQRIHVVIPLHPRTKARVEASEESLLEGLLVLDPIDYPEFVALEAAARLVITDSGGVQEETTALGIPCLTYRTTTERPITISHGTNALVGTDPERLRTACDEVLSSPAPTRAPEIPLWDGRAGGRAATAIEEHLERWRRAEASARPGDRP